MALSIRLSRGGSKKRPYYRIVVADARSPRDGKFIEKIGTYNPLLAKDSDQRIQLDTERARHWIGVGAQPTDAVEAILKVTGDWQKYKGLPAPAPMKVAEPKADKRALFEAAAKESADEPQGEAITQKAKKGDKKADESKADSASESTEA